MNNTIDFDITGPDGIARGRHSWSAGLAGGAADEITQAWNSGLGVIPRTPLACDLVSQLTAALEEWL